MILTVLMAGQPVWAASESSADDSDDTVEESGSAYSGFDKGFDAVVIRPLGAAALVTGAVFLVPAVLLSAPGGQEGIDDAYDVLVKTPWQEVADRPLGDI